jgi:hypothetical protein
MGFRDNRAPTSLDSGLRRNDDPGPLLVIQPLDSCLHENETTEG